MNKRLQILLISNVVTIVVTASAVLLALHWDASTAQHRNLEHSGERHLQDCCECTPAPSPTPQFCFEASSGVQVQDPESGAKNIKSIQELKVGDWVQVGHEEEYERIYGFGHYGPEHKGTDFIKLSVKVPNHDGPKKTRSLVLSPSHMVWSVESHAFVQASAVKVGSTLLWNSLEVAVTTIESNANSDGLYAPFTPSGRLVVDGFLASTFVAVFEGDMQLPWWWTGESHNLHQWIAHTFELPHRLVCHHFGACEDVYTEDGISIWVAKPLEVVEWVFKKTDKPFGWIIQQVAWTVAVLALLGLSILQMVFFDNPVIGRAALTMCGLSAYYYFLHGTKRVATKAEKKYV